MKWRHFLLASVMMITPSAWAATVQPESAWAVTRVGAKAAGASPYCALARRFENNIIMTFARNTRDETSVAIDFQQPVFSDDQSVQVNLDTGTGAPREFLLKPASNKAVVARIGADTAFYKEIEANSGMNATVLGQDYKFIMPDMGSANTQLETCLAGLSNNAMPNGDGDAGMDNKIAALQDQIETLKTQRQAMASDLDTKQYSAQLGAAAGDDNADLADKIAKMQLQNMALRDNVESQRSAYENLQTKTLEDKSRVVLLEETQDQLRRAQEGTRQFRQALSVTQERQEILLEKLDQYSSAETKRKELEKHLAAVRDENAQLVSSLKDEKDRLELVKSAQDAVLAQQQQELTKTKEVLAKTSTERDVFKTRLQEYATIKDKLTALSGEQRALGDTVQALQSERADLNNKLAAERDNLETIKLSKKALENQANLDKAEKEKLARLLDEEKKKQSDIAGLETNLGQLKTQQKELSSKVDSLAGEKKTLQTRVADLEGKVRLAETEKKRAVQEKEALVDDLAEVDQLAAMQSETIDTLTIKQKGLLTKISSLEGEKNDLLAQMSGQKNQLASIQSDAKTNRDQGFEFDRLKDQIAQLTRERDDMRMALKSEKDRGAELAMQAGGSDGLRQLYTQVEELEYQRVDLNSALEFERARNLNDTAPAAGGDTSLVELRASLTAIQAERDEYKRLLDEERVRTKKLESIAGTLGTKETVAEMNARIKKLETDNVTLLRELEYEKARSTDVTTASINTTGKGDLQTVTRLRDEVKRLQTQSKELETQQGTLLTQVRQLESEKQKMAQGQPVVTSAPQNNAETIQLKAQIAALQSEKDSLAQLLTQRDAAAKTAATTAVSAQSANAQVAQSAQREADKAAREAEALRAQLAQAQTLLVTRQAQAASPVIDRAEPMAMAAPSRNIEGDLRGLLQKSDIGNVGSFGPVTLPVASDVQGWRWKVGSLTGNAESSPAPDMPSQNAIMDNFLAKAKSRCPGDFAVIENSRSQSARGLIVSTDIACVAGSNGVAAAISFVQFGDRLVTISHEAATTNMADAMATRDKLVQAALQSSAR